MVGCEFIGMREARTLNVQFRPPRVRSYFFYPFWESPLNTRIVLSAAPLLSGASPLFEHRYYLRAPYNITLLTTTYCHSNKERRRGLPTLGDKHLLSAAPSFQLESPQCEEGCARYEHRSSLILPSFVLFLSCMRRVDRYTIGFT